MAVFGAWVLVGLLERSEPWLKRTAIRGAIELIELLAIYHALVKRRCPSREAGEQSEGEARRRRSMKTPCQMSIFSRNVRYQIGRCAVEASLYNRMAIDNRAI